MPRPSGLHVKPRLSKTTGKTEGWTIAGVVGGVRIRRRAQSNDAKLAREEARNLEAELLRNAWHGERRGVRTFAQGVLAYFDAEPRTEATKARYNRVLQALGPNVKLAEINQDTVTDLKKRLLRPNHKPATVTREIINPLRAVMRLAQERGWADAPKFHIPAEREGRTLYLLPAQFDRLVAAAAPHVKPLLIFLAGTGARMSEALELDWQDVDLTGARAIFWRTKGGKRRNAHLPAVVVATLANLPHREGRVFRWRTRARVSEYVGRDRGYGGQIKRGFAGAVSRAGLNPDLTPHDLRHTWASWHYALNKDLLALKIEGGWSSLALVERYAHLLPAGHETAIRRALGIGRRRRSGTVVAPVPKREGQPIEKTEKTRERARAF
jgi:integrase